MASSGPVTAANIDELAAFQQELAAVEGAGDGGAGEGGRGSTLGSFLSST
jgi:hypothetical protein